MENLPNKILNYEKVLFRNISNLLNKKLKNVQLTSTTKYNDSFGHNEIHAYNNDNKANNNIELSKLLFHSNSNIPWYRLKVNNIIIYEGLQKIEIPNILKDK